MHYKFKPFEGPERYRFKDPDSGVEFEEHSKQSLIDRVTAYRRQNNYPEIEELPFVLESYWCGLPENEGKCVEVDVEPRGWLGYLKGGVALVVNLVYDRVVSREIADKRSEQCAGCKYNVKPPNAGAEAWANKIALLSVGDRKSKRHEDIGVCGVCTCPLRAKVFAAGPFDINPDHRDRLEEVKCWQLEK